MLCRGDGVQRESWPLWPRCHAKTMLGFYKSFDSEAARGYLIVSSIMRTHPMKAFFLAAGALFAVVFVFLTNLKVLKETPFGKDSALGISPHVQKKINSKSSPSPPAQLPQSRFSSVFVPYWSRLDGISSDSSDVLYYFGVAVNAEGVVRSDPGYVKMFDFLKATPGRVRYLTVRMLDKDVIAQILASPELHSRIARSIAQTARENGFDGIVLNLEVGLMSFHIAPKHISTFSEELRRAARQEQLVYSMTFYGDTFFRKRPYDVAVLGEMADEVILMAYDFHKTFGSPGPNFPMSGAGEYGYDFESMVRDFTRLIPPEKIYVAFGMYGYQWDVDEQDRPSRSAEAITLAQARARFGESCGLPGCRMRRDPISAEMEVRYEGESGRTIVTWYEDEESVRMKTAVMERYGIGNKSFWAFGYY